MPSAIRLPRPAAGCTNIYRPRFSASHELTALCLVFMQIVLSPVAKQFSAGTGSSLGFTVASPAYDLSFDPPAFLGVSGVDYRVQVRNRQWRMGKQYINTRGRFTHHRSVVGVLLPPRPPRSPADTCDCFLHCVSEAERNVVQQCQRQCLLFCA